MKLLTSLLSLLIIFVLLLPCLVACAPQNVETPQDTTTAPDNTDPTPAELKLNDTPIENYTIVYAAAELDFNLRAAEYIKNEISKVTGKELEIKLDTEANETDLEILVGLTNRTASASAAAVELGDFDFIASATGTKVVLYGEEYMVAGAAYNFIAKTVLSRESDSITVAEDLTPKTHEFETPNNIILLVASGMGFNSLEYGEDLFIDGTYMMSEDNNLPQYNVAARLPYKASSHITALGANTAVDGAAGGTALATGYNTHNGVVGMNTDFEVLKNITEVAIEKGKMTAILSTEDRDAATPAAFSAHIHTRSETVEIASQQEASEIDLVYGNVADVSAAIRKAFREVGDAENGFFLMYDEAYLDKCAHDDAPKAFYSTYTKLNSALRTMMEFMMYNPDTLLIFTSDHETGGITWNEETSVYEFTTGEHTGVNVPFYALGKGAEHIDGNTYENVYIPKLIAKLMGEDNFGDPSIPDTTDATGLEVPSEDELKAAADKEQADRDALAVRLEEQEKAELAEREQLRAERHAAD